MLLRRFLLACCFLCFALSAQAADIQEVTSKKGIKAWLIQDRSTPILALHFAFRGGVEQDPGGRQGLSMLLADLLTEGAGKRDAKAFHQALADHGVSFGLGAGRDSISGALYTLTAELPAAAELARDALTRPRFDAEAIERLRQRQLGNIKAQLADPDWQSRRAMFAALFPRHPYAYRSLGTAASLNGITQDDLQAEFTRRIARGNLLVSAVGDITPDALAALLDKIFGRLPAQPYLRKIDEISAPAAGKIIHVPQQGGQSIFFFAAPGIKRGDPDWHAASLLNYILGGGGFESRLMTEVRDKRGLTYGISTSLSSMERSGLITGGAKTANAKAGEAWQVTRETWEKTWREGVTAEELKAAQDYLIGVLATGFTSSGSIAAMLLSLQKDRLPREYFDQRAGLLRAVKLEDIKRVAQRLLDPVRLTLVITGEPQNIKPDSTEPFVNE